MFFFVSCEKETPISENINIEKSFPMPIGAYKKNLQVPDMAKGFTFTFEITSNNQKVLDAFDEQSLTLQVNIPEEKDNVVDPNSVPEYIAEHLKGGDEKVTTFDANRHFVTIQPTNIVNNNLEEEEITNYDVSFSDKVREQLRSLNAATILKLNQPKASFKTEAWWLYLPYSKTVRLKGDGGNIPTKVHINYAYNAGPYWANAWLHTGITFYNCIYCSICSHQGNGTPNYVDDVYIYQDVLCGWTTYSACYNYTCNTPC